MIDDCASAGDGCYGWSISTWTAQYLIEPSPGEVDGQPVAFCAVWSGEVSAQADSDSSAGAIAGGDDSSVTDPPVVPVELFPEPASVVINGGEQEYFFGPLSVSAPPTAADSDQVRRVILARIGDTIDAEAGALAAAVTPDGSSAAASAHSTLRLELCPIPGIPATNTPALAALATLLGIGGMWAMRRRRAIAR